MEFPHVLCDQLAELSEALAEPGTDLQAILAVLIDDITAAVPSFLGLTMTLQIDGGPVTLTATDPDLAARANASIKLPVGPIAGGPAGTIIFYAHDPGAFTDLATSTRRAFNLDGQVVLDGHLRSHSTARADQHPQHHHHQPSSRRPHRPRLPPRSSRGRTVPPRQARWPHPCPRSPRSPQLDHTAILSHCTPPGGQTACRGQSLAPLSTRAAGRRLERGYLRPRVGNEVAGRSPE